MMIAAMILVVLFGFSAGMPIAFALGLGTVCYIALTGVVPLSLVASEYYVAFDNLILSAVPLFLFTGLVMSEGSLTERLIDFANSLIGRVRGGLAYVNIISNMIMAGMSGAATSDAAATGSVLIPAMTRAGYPKAFSGAITAAAATIGPVIPPSIPMLVYASFADVSVGRAFLAGVVPGFGMGIAFMGIALWLSVRRKYPITPVPFSLLGVARATVRVAPALSVPGIIIGGIVFGVFTATEASAVAAIMSILISGLLYRELTSKSLYKVALQAAVVSGVIMTVLGLAKGLSWILTRERIASSMSQLLLHASHGQTSFLLLLTAILLILGCFLDATPIMIIVLPVVIPVAKSLGVDLILMGVVVVLSLMVGLLTPPVGITAMLVCSMTNLKMYELVREAWPFWLGIIAVILLTILFPGIVMWVPNLVMPSG